MTALDIPVEERSPELALKTFKFVKSSGSAASKEACAATMLAWLRGDKWTAHPECAHPMICDAVIRGNDDDVTTEEQQRQIFLAGVDGMLDTWWVPTQVVLAAIAGAPKEATKAEFALFVEGAVAAWKAAPDKERPDLYGANLYATRGDSLTRLPSGCKVSEAGLVVKTD